MTFHLKAYSKFKNYPLAQRALDEAILHEGGIYDRVITEGSRKSVDALIDTLMKYTVLDHAEKDAMLATAILSTCSGRMENDPASAAIDYNVMTGDFLVQMHIMTIRGDDLDPHKAVICIRAAQSTVALADILRESQEALDNWNTLQDDEKQECAEGVRRILPDVKDSAPVVKLAAECLDDMPLAKRLTALHTACTLNLRTIDSLCKTGSKYTPSNKGNTP